MRDTGRKEIEMSPENLFKAQLAPVGMANLRKLELMLAGEPGTNNHQVPLEVYREALNFDKKKRCPIQWGALGDPFDNIERNQKLGIDVIKLLTKYKQPCRISTKGRLVAEKPYIKLMSPELFWIAFSIITPDDEMSLRVEKWAPSTSERLAAMKKLSKQGFSTSLRFRPAIPGISDRTKNNPRAHLELIERSAEAGARSISFEVLFVPSIQPPHIKFLMEKLEKIAGTPLTRWYRKTSIGTACLRSSRTWKEEFMLSTIEKARECGLIIGVSDPHWKEESDFGCCCGIPPDDPYFGGWQRHNALEAIHKARRTKKPVTAEDGVPAWSDKVTFEAMICQTGPKKVHLKRIGYTWGDKLRAVWNDVRSPRGPLRYFEGVLMPKGEDKKGNIKYVYKKPARKKKKAPFWQTSKK
jgi:DNA repair photolyase